MAFHSGSTRTSLCAIPGGMTSTTTEETEVVVQTTFSFFRGAFFILTKLTLKIQVLRGGDVGGLVIPRRLVIYQQGLVL